MYFVKPCVLVSREKKRKKKEKEMGGRWVDAKVWVEDPTPSSDGDGGFFFSFFFFFFFFFSISILLMFFFSTLTPNFPHKTGGTCVLYLIALAIFVIIVCPFVLLPLWWSQDRCELIVTIGTLTLYLTPTLFCIFYCVHECIGKALTVILATLTAFTSSGCLMFVVVEMWSGQCSTLDSDNHTVRFIIPGVLVYSLLLCCCPSYFWCKACAESNDDGYTSV